MGEGHVPAGDMTAQIQGEVSGQVAVGNYILQIGSVHGGVVNLVPPDRQPVPRARAAPVLLRPRPFGNLLDREAEVGAATEALRSALCVGLRGEPGLGKTVLLRCLAHGLDADAFPDGVVYLSARHHAAADLLQCLFDAFYECDAPLKPTEAQVQHALHGKRALVLLDDVELARDELEELMNAAPNCAFAFTSGDRLLWGEGRDVALHGLPLEAGLALVEQELGRALAPDERPAASDLCTALGGNPLRIIQAVATVREGQRTLAALAGQFGGKPPGEAVADEALAGLSDPERRMVSALAALGGAPAAAEHLAAIADVPDAEVRLEALQRRGLVQRQEGRYQLAGAVAGAVGRLWDLGTWSERAAAHLATWAEGRQEGSPELAEAAGTIAGALEPAVASGRWADVNRLARAVEGSLALSGHWEAWAETAQRGLAAAQVLGERSEEARWLHQMGTRALCLTDHQGARASLVAALETRESLGDRTGAAVTRHNISLLPTLAPPGRTARSLSPAAKGAMGLLAAAIVIGVVALIGPRVWKGGGNGPVPVPPVSVPSTGPGQAQGQDASGGSPQKAPGSIETPALVAGKLWVSSTALDFGETRMGERGSRLLTVRNDGQGALPITAALEAGRPFTMPRQAFVLNPGEQRTLTVEFAPTKEGRVSGALRLAGRDEQTQTEVALRGSGTARKLTARLSVSAASLDFGTVPVGQRPVRQLTLHNDGPDSLTVVAALTEGRAFATTWVPEALGPGKERALTVTFTPTKEGAFSDILRLAGRELGAPVSVSLRGVGMSGPDGGRLAVSPQVLDWGEVPVGERVEKLLTVRNNGGGSLWVTSELGGGDPFSLAGATFTLGPREERALRLQFAPTREGLFADGLRVVSRDPAAQIDVALRGHGVARAGTGTLSVAPAQIDFGTVQVGASKEGSVRVANTGQAELRFRVARAPISPFRLSREPDLRSTTVRRLRFYSIGPGNGTTLTVKFRPAAPGRFTGTLEIGPGASAQPAQTVTLTGSGAAAAQLADLAAFSIRPAVTSRTSQYAGRVEIIGVVRNVGRGAYDPPPDGRQAQLRADGTVVARVSLGHLEPGAETAIRYQRNWNRSSPNEGEFPPTYRLVVPYDRDRDASGANNETELPGRAINALF